MALSLVYSMRTELSGAEQVDPVTASVIGHARSSASASARPTSQRLAADTATNWVARGVFTARELN